MISLVSWSFGPSQPQRVTYIRARNERQSITYLFRTKVNWINYSAQKSTELIILVFLPNSCSCASRSVPAFLFPIWFSCNLTYLVNLGLHIFKIEIRVYSSKRVKGSWHSASLRGLISEGSVSFLGNLWISSSEVGYVHSKCQREASKCVHFVHRLTVSRPRSYCDIKLQRKRYSPLKKKKKKKERKR